MSKIGKISISIPEKVKAVLSGSVLNIEGPLGKKSLNIDLEMFNLDITEGKEISINPKVKDQNSKRLWGMNRSLINNAVIGSSTGYEKILELVGVGYRAALKDKQLNLQLGYSHDINFDIPEGIKIVVEKQTVVKVSGSDKQQVGMVVSKIKAFRKPEPYKGKGIREHGQYILRKEGKKEIMKLNTIQRKKFRVTGKLKKVAPSDRLRLSISRSAKNISAQIIDDVKNITLVSCSSIEKDIRSMDKVNKTDISKIVAEKLAKKAQEKKISKIFFDRGIYKYHGRVKVFAETLRKNGMEF